MTKYPNQLETPTAIIVFTKMENVGKSRKTNIKGWKEIKIVEREKNKYYPELFFSTPQQKII